MRNYNDTGIHPMSATSAHNGLGMSLKNDLSYQYFPSMCVSPNTENIFSVYLRVLDVFTIKDVIVKSDLKGERCRDNEEKGVKKDIKRKKDHRAC